MILRLKYYVIILIVLLSCEGPFFEIPPEPDTTAPLVEITNPGVKPVVRIPLCATSWFGKSTTNSAAKLEKYPTIGDQY